MNLIDASVLFWIIVIAIILIIHILIAVIFANKMQEITDLKNYDGSIWGWSFFLVFVLGVAGMVVSTLMAIAIPKLNDQRDSD